MLERPPHSPNRRAAALKAARGRRYRQRVRACSACYTVEIGGEVLDLLVRLHWIGEEQLVDKRAVEAALGEMLRASAELERLADAAR